MKQVISKKLLNKCKLIGNKNYIIGYANGLHPNNIIECWYAFPTLGEPISDSLLDADLINTRLNSFRPYIRAGQKVKYE